MGFAANFAREFHFVYLLIVSLILLSAIVATIVDGIGRSLLPLFLRFPLFSPLLTCLLDV